MAASQIIKWVFAKSGKCPGFTGYWYDGNRKPKKPAAMGEHKLPNTATMFVGTKGVLVSASDYNDSPQVYVDGKKIKPEYKQLAPRRNGDIHENWLKALTGEIAWHATCSNFMYAGKITAIINMGTIAERLNKKLTFSAKTMKFDDERANAIMARAPREGWEKAYKV